MRQIVFFLLFSLCLFHAKAENKTIKFSQQLTIDKNLSDNGVTSIFEDSRGYLWISTYDGLNRYDGYEFKVYKNSIKNKILSSNRIRTIAEDKKNNLWIGTDNGISIYNYCDDNFSNIYSNKNTTGEYKGPIVRKIVMNKDNDLIVCTSVDEGLLIFKNNYSFISQIIPPNKLADKAAEFFDGIALDESNYLFLTTVGLVHFNIKTEQFLLVYSRRMKKHGALLKLNDSTLLTTLDKGLGVFKVSKQSENYSIELLRTELPEYDFRGASVDVLGGLWLGVANLGVLQVDNVNALVKGDSFQTKIFTKRNGRIRTSCVTTSARSGCWVGSFDKGIMRFNLKDKAFKTYNPNVDYGLDRLKNNISHIAAIDDKRVLLCAGTSGLVLLNTETDKFEPLPAELSTRDTKTISSVFVDSEQSYWVYLDRNKFGRIRKGTNTIEEINLSENVNNSFESARIITEDKFGNIWLGSINNVYKISLNSKREIINVDILKNNPFCKNAKISKFRCIYQDPKYDFIWIGSDTDGLFRISLVENQSLNDAHVEHFTHQANNEESISHNFVSSILRLPNNELWIGTEGGGICMVVNSPTKPKFIAYGEEQGLSNNVVKTLMYDDDNNLWIGTNVGLNRLNINDMNFRSFRSEDGLPFEDFMYASKRLNNGCMLISGQSNLCYFYPNNVLDKEMLPQLIISNFKIQNKEISPGDTVNNRVLLERPINNLDEILLKYDENVFSFQLTSLHFATLENHYLKYQLFPVNKDWIKVPSNQRSINYNGLQPGQYELRVMASNSLNEWTAPQTLKITIKPPFWLTPWAFIMYIVLVALIIYSILYYILRMNKLSHKLEIEHLEKETVKEVNDAKLQFFSNISHEIKTPLTLITGPLNLMSERYKGNVDLFNKLKIVQRQSKKIAQLIDQVHDFQRSDANKLKMNYSLFNFNNFVQELLTDFNFLAVTENKKLELRGGATSVYVSADKDKIEKIINNILNNAFKYSKVNDLITIAYKVSNKELQLSVTDTGNGISEDDLPHIFERFYQSKHKHSAYTGGSGIGLAFTKRLVEMHYGYIDAQSQINEGTTIKVKLPIVVDKPEGSLDETENHILANEKAFNDSNVEMDSLESASIEVSGNFSEARVFFAEDNTDMRQFVSGFLSSFFKVTAFANGKELVDALQNQWPDIVLSDVLMPEMNGFELCKYIKSDVKTSHIPVVLLTACTTIEDQLKGLNEGADSYIKKPFNVQHVVTRIETLLQNRKQLRERFQIDFPLTINNTENNNKDIAFLEKLYALMEENLDNSELDMKNLARKLYLNRTHFFQKVKELTNNTPYQLLKEYRLKRASEMLVNNKATVNEVFMMTGFKSRSHFSRHFKSKYNTTPGKYAALIKQTK